jgi:hypothetical protein
LDFLTYFFNFVFHILKIKFETFQKFNLAFDNAFQAIYQSKSHLSIEFVVFSYMLTENVLIDIYRIFWVELLVRGESADWEISLSIWGTSRVFHFPWAAHSCPAWRCELQHNLEFSHFEKRLFGKYCIYILCVNQPSRRRAIMLSIFSFSTSFIFLCFVYSLLNDERYTERKIERERERETSVYF